MPSANPDTKGYLSAGFLLRLRYRNIRPLTEGLLLRRFQLHWAATQTNLGKALRALGQRESGTARLEEGVAACRAALEELTREAAPYWHDIAQQNLARCLALLEQRRKP